MGRRAFSITIIISVCLLAAHPAFADTIDFQTAVASGGGAQTQSGGATTGSQVQTVDLGDVTGTVCDCGEIAPAGESAPGAASKGGFPKFPLFALAVLPIFIPPDNPPPPTPPNPPEVPEPLTLATLAAGLAALAGIRTRRVK